VCSRRIRAVPSVRSDTPSMAQLASDDSLPPSRGELSSHGCPSHNAISLSQLAPAGASRKQAA
jgi:hypothetical protein